MSVKKRKIAVIGGGVAGVTSALYLGQLGLDVTLFEKESSLVGGPPFCHLHAGGNLYREISDTQCIKLLKQSIDFLKFYPFVVDYRPTVIVLPLADSSRPNKLFPRLEMLKKAYQGLINQDPNNEVLGKSDAYYTTYSKEEMLVLKNKKVVSHPKSDDDWMIPVAQNIDFTCVQFPLIMVQEYGLNLFRLSAGVSIALTKLQNVEVKSASIVHNIQKDFLDDSWEISYVKEDHSLKENFDYIINATGFRTGKIDDILGVPCKRMVEFKSAYVSRWDSHASVLFPEIIFHGERGTPQGMGQFTPYPNGYFQLHGMTNDITLYKDGLVANSMVSCQPHLKQDFIEKIDKSWREEEVIERTNNAIQHLSQFIPAFSTAKVGSKPLFGAQQIPGDDPTLRVAEVSFPREKYARCEIVKVSSVLDMVQTIAREFIGLGYLEKSVNLSQTIEVSISEENIQHLAESIAHKRNYPKSLANRNINKKG